VIKSDKNGYVTASTVIWKSGFGYKKIVNQGAFRLVHIG
jgi:hypothetical protein